MPTLSVFIKAILSCQLDGTFIRFCTAVAEKQVVISSCLTECLCKICLCLCIIQVGSMLQGLCLLANGIDPCFIAVAQRIRSDTASEVDILLSGFILTGFLLALFQYNWKPAICSHNILILLFLCCHVKFLLFLLFLFPSTATARRHFVSLSDLKEKQILFFRHLAVLVFPDNPTLSPNRTPLPSAPAEYKGRYHNYSHQQR